MSLKMTKFRKCSTVGICVYLDVSVSDVNVVEELDGCANVPHDLKCLWEETIKQILSNQKQSLIFYFTTGGANERKKETHP